MEDSNSYRGYYHDSLEDAITGPLISSEPFVSEGTEDNQTTFPFLVVSDPTSTLVWHDTQTFIPVPQAAPLTGSFWQFNGGTSDANLVTKTAQLQLIDTSQTLNPTIYLTMPDPARTVASLHGGPVMSSTSTERTSAAPYVCDFEGCNRSFNRNCDLKYVQVLLLPKPVSRS